MVRTGNAYFEKSERGYGDDFAAKLNGFAMSSQA